MKRYSLLLTVSILLVFASARATFAVFPQPDGSVVLSLGMGWFNGNQAWFINTDTTDPSLAASQGLTLFYARPAGAAPVYVITNPAEMQGPVFSVAPDPVPRPYRAAPYYSGIWQAVYVTWNAGASIVPLVSEQQIADLEYAGALTLLTTDIVVDYSIVAVGPLDRPYYLIPQAQDIDLANWDIRLPTWNTYGQDRATGRTFVKRVIIPDAFSTWGPVVGSIDIAALIGSNPAYGLGSIGPVDNDNTFAVVDWMQFPSNGGMMPVSPDQFLIHRDLPTACGAANMNSHYSPLARMIVFVRLGFVPYDAVFSNWAQVTTSPGLIGVYGTTVNAPVLCQ